MKNNVKFILKLFFKNSLAFSVLLYLCITTSVISSTQIACGVMCEQNVIKYFKKKKSGVSYLKQI